MMDDNIIIDWSSKTILIVEDDKLNAYVFENLLKKTKAKTILAATGEKAVEMAISLKPDLILMDIKLPGIDGMEATRQIKTFSPNVIIIAQTAFATESDKEEILNSGCDDFIAKPIRYEKLIATIGKYFID